MWIISLVDDLHKMPSLVFSENGKKKIQMSSATILFSDFSVAHV